jgi:hypothetical protein
LSAQRAASAAAAFIIPQAAVGCKMPRLTVRITAAPRNVPSTPEAFLESVARYREDLVVAAEWC